MAFRKKVGKDINSSIPLKNNPKKTELSSYIKKIVNGAQYDFHETETMVVTRVIVNQTPNHGAVMGNFIEEPDQEIKGGVVLPLMPHITHIPLIGEHVVVVEYIGQHYYIGVVNLFNRPNENSLPGVAGDYDPTVKYGNTFQRRDTRKVYVNEGDIVFEGRFGNTIKFGSNQKNQAPNIKIRAGESKPPEDSKYINGDVVKESFNNDGSSIYLLTNEKVKINAVKTSGGKSFSEQTVRGTSIVMNSDKLFFNARKNNINIRAGKDVVIQGDEVFIHANKKGTIKLGNPKSLFIPTLNSQVLHELLIDVMFTIMDGFTAIGKATNPVGLVDAAKDIAQIVAQRVPNIVDVVSNEKYFNKEIMIALPNFNIPKSGDGASKDSKNIADGDETGIGTDGKFDSKNFERGSNRTADGRRDTGPRKY
tara:strand:- start:2836 stop:4098 length:1263 start_codon:yes stop_codon:yes gene_type:complete